MENKYYKPNLEEFCEGFKYERYVGEGFYQNKSIHEKQSDNWISDICNIMDIKSVISLLSINNLKVKYLDKDDIEELEWLHITKNKYLYGEWQLLLHSEEKLISIGIHEFKMFKINIKNKSELKKLMKQLEIINEEEKESTTKSE